MSLRPAMQTPPRRRRDRPYWVLVLAAVFALLPLGGPVHLNELSEDTVKAGFLYNFAQFAEWPDGTIRTRRIVFCVQTDSIGPSVFRGWNRGTDGTRPLDVRFFAETEIPTLLGGCDVLYTSGVGAAQLEVLRAYAVQENTLLVSDTGGFAARGGHIELYVEDGQFRFRVNLGSYGQSGVRLSSKVLGLAEIVGDGGRQ